jgi:signal transduction histidine kinase
MVGERRKRQNRMAFLGELAGGLAHEVRNPLSTMKVNLQLLSEEFERDAGPETSGKRAQRRIATLQQAVARLEEIVNDFLNFARGLELNREPSDLNGVIEEVVVFVEPEAKRHGVHLRTAYAPDLPSLDVDRKYLQQALLNLLLNARQAIAETGRPGELMITTRRDGDRVRVDVTDTGPGIPPDALPRIFDAFFSTKKGGTGLGLATTRRIVEEHGGTIDAASEVGKGTSFTIRLPVRRAK